MNDPVGIAARAAAQQLQAEAGPGLVAEVEAVLATRESPSAPPQYVDPAALASLIVAIASLAWTVYTDLRKRTAKPSAEVVARTVRVTRRDQGQAAEPDHIVEVVVTETIRAAADRGSGSTGGKTNGYTSDLRRLGGVLGPGTGCGRLRKSLWPRGQLSGCPVGERVLRTPQQSPATYRPRPGRRDTA